MPDNRTDTNAPIPGQPAAVVAIGQGGPYLARFPYEAAGGRDTAHRVATNWRDRYAPAAIVLGFTGTVNLVWEAQRAERAAEAPAPSAPALKPWTVIIYPDFYSDDDDHGYCWAGFAADQADAIEQACRECEATNEIEEGEINADDISTSDLGPCWRMIAEQMAAALKAGNPERAASLFAENGGPEGEDYTPGQPDEIRPGEFDRAKLAGYDVEPDGFAGGWLARDPEGEEIPENEEPGGANWPTERAAWEACDRHRMFGETADNRAAMRAGYCVRATTTYEGDKPPRPGFMAIPPGDSPALGNVGTFSTEADAWAACEAHRKAGAQ